MKSLFQHMIDIVVLIIMFFMFASLLQTELQIKEARDVHASAIQAVQASYYDQETITKLNEQIHQDYPDSWVLSIQEVTGLDEKGNVTLSVLYQFQETGVVDGKITGKLEAVHSLKNCEKLKSAGIVLSS